MDYCDIFFKKWDVNYNLKMPNVYDSTINEINQKTNMFCLANIYILHVF